MSKSYDDYEKECEKIRKDNEKHLKTFEDELKAKGLSAKTIKNHIENVDLYINEYMLREDAQLLEDGLCGLDSFFYFYIHKCMWSTPSSVKGMAASLKKFYKSMADKGLVDKDNFDIFAADIKESVPIWQEECADFNGDDW